MHSTYYPWMHTPAINGTIRPCLAITTAPTTLEELLRRVRRECPNARSGPFAEEEDLNW